MKVRLRKMKTNFDLLFDTCNMLKYSQGFYGRLLRDLNMLSPFELDELRTTLNNLPQWKDTLDCVMYLEQ